MKRIDIEHGRWSYKEHKFYTKEVIESWYLDKVYKGIHDRLQITDGFALSEKTVLKCVDKRLKDILIATPKKLEVYRRYFDLLKRTLSPLKSYFEKQSDDKGRQMPSQYSKFRDHLLKVFNYEGYRQGILRELANRLNIKTCPYCNLHYTLCIEDFNNRDVLEMMAKFQFDHFFDKAEYPILSMSLYNLIPSCPICNQGKTTNLLPLDFHPYQSDICRLFKFAVDDPINLFTGSDQLDEEIELVKTTEVDLDGYDKTFHIKKLYMRHKDVMQDIFVRVYQNEYYEQRDNFPFIEKQDLRDRVFYGFFPDEKDINLRPMTKFQQDLWEQAQGYSKQVGTN